MVVSSPNPHHCLQILHFCIFPRYSHPSNSSWVHWLQHPSLPFSLAVLWPRHSWYFLKAFLVADLPWTLSVSAPSLWRRSLRTGTSSLFLANSKRNCCFSTDLVHHHSAWDLPRLQHRYRYPHNPHRIPLRHHFPPREQNLHPLFPKGNHEYEN